ncbi:MAG: outer membrane lipoprotein carrier protein LolA [Cryomorphaceae bacterium]
MKKITWMVIGMMALTTALFAQRSEEELTPQDPKAQEILDALSNKAKEYKSFTADFEYVMVNKEAGINEKQTGTVQMKGQKKYKLEVAGREIMSDGESVWTFLKEVGELQISEMPDEEEDEGNIMNPANAFHMYKKGFKYQYVGKETVDGKEADVILMFPMEPGKKPFHTVIVNIDKARLELISMVVKYKNGDMYTYRLKNFKANAPLSDSDFEFDEDRDDVEDVIDLR